MAASQFFTLLYGFLSASRHPLPAFPPYYHQAGNTTKTKQESAKNWLV